MTRRLVASMLFLLSAVVCVTDTANYHELSDELKTYVDRAIMTGNHQLNYDYHLNFDKMGQMKEISSHQVRIDVRLRATTCGRASGSETHRSECPFKMRRVRCMVCGWCPHRPSIDCVRRSDEDGRFARWNEMCKPSPSKEPICPAGPKGERGYVGAQGVEGLQGYTGARGPEGLRGYTGARGPKGERGYTGARGPKGERGYTGARGPKDLKAVISVSPNMKIVSGGQQQVLEGFSFALTCSFPKAHPDAYFDLRLNSTDIDQRPSAHGSACFLRPAADHTHQGNYRCLYAYTAADGSPAFSWSEPLPLAVRAASADSFNDFNDEDFYDEE